ncbi:hypothetical protein [Brachybacterium sp.]|uniref:hypothetical protein n=1 Tax=Brachybacterium sp. TaxID=1891286 RepID=UPI002ED56ABB
MTTRVPRYLTRRPAPKPWRPLLDALEAYGVTDYVPETATVTHGRRGITIDVMIPDPEAEDLPMIHDDTFEPVLRRRFYPHPTR